MPHWSVSAPPPDSHSAEHGSAAATGSCSCNSPGTAGQKLFKYRCDLVLPERSPSAPGKYAHLTRVGGLPGVR